MAVKTLQVRRPPRKLTKTRRELWLAHFSLHGNKAAACRATDTEPKGIDALVKANRYFAQRLDEAKAEAVGRLEEEAFRRAIEGVDEFVVSDGRVVRYKGKPIIRTNYSDALLSKLLAAHGGDAYRTKTDATLTHRVDSEQTAKKLTDALARRLGKLEPEDED